MIKEKESIIFKEEEGEASGSFAEQWIVEDKKSDNDVIIKEDSCTMIKEKEGMILKEEEGEAWV